MRLALLGLTASLFALPLSAQTFSHVSQSSVTLAATYSRPGDFDKTDKERSDGDYNVSFPISTVRFGNSQLLDVLVYRGTKSLPGGIPEKKGWAIVAVWADWESNGASSFRFFARKKIAGGYDTRRIPDEVLALELLDPYVIKTIKTQTNGETVEILSGSDYFKAYSRLTLGDDPRDDEDDEGGEEEADPADRLISASTPLGMLSGSGRYARPSAADAAFYLPNAASFTGYANSELDSTGGENVVVASLRLGKSKAVPSDQYDGEDEFTGTNASLGVDSTAVVGPSPE